MCIGLFDSNLAFSSLVHVSDEISQFPKHKINHVFTSSSRKKTASPKFPNLNQYFLLFFAF